MSYEGKKLELLITTLDAIKSYEYIGNRVSFDVLKTDRKSVMDATLLEGTKYYNFRLRQDDAPIGFVINTYRIPGFFRPSFMLEIEVQEYSKYSSAHIKDRYQYKSSKDKRVKQIFDIVESKRLQMEIDREENKVDVYCKEMSKHIDVATKRDGKLEVLLSKGNK